VLPAFVIAFLLELLQSEHPINAIDATNNWEKVILLFHYSLSLFCVLQTPESVTFSIKLIQDQWVLQTLAGYQLDLKSTPCQNHIPQVNVCIVIFDNYCYYWYEIHGLPHMLLSHTVVFLQLWLTLLSTIEIGPTHPNLYFLYKDYLAFVKDFNTILITCSCITPTYAT